MYFDITNSNFISEASVSVSDLNCDRHIKKKVANQRALRGLWLLMTMYFDLLKPTFVTEFHFN